MAQNRRVVIFGGAGFIGGRLAQGFYEDGYRVTVVDGLFPGTGGNLKNLGNIREKISLILADITQLPQLQQIIESNDLIVDAMGWTSHIDSINNPDYDLKLNQQDHLHLVQTLFHTSSRRVIYLGSRSQYGKTTGESIDESSPLMPNDIQGVHKLAAESYFRIYSEKFKWHVLSLRLPNVFGVGQKTEGNDIGLIGGMIRTALHDQTIEVFSGSRKRNVLYVDDLVKMIMEIERKEWTFCFMPLNIPGNVVQIYDLAQQIVQLSGSGRVELKEMPPEIATIDFNIELSSHSFFEWVNMKYSDIGTSLKCTIDYFKNA